jgi:hypothetical protein
MKKNKECPNRACCKIIRYGKDSVVCTHYGAGCGYCATIEEYNKDITKPERQFLNKNTN